MIEKFLSGENIIFSDVVGFEKDLIYLRREGEPLLVRKYIGGGGLYQSVFTLCMRCGSSGDFSLLTDMTDRLLAAPLPGGAVSFEITKAPHVTNNSATTQRAEAECRLVWAKNTD